MRSRRRSSHWRRTATRGSARPCSPRSWRSCTAWCCRAKPGRHRRHQVPRRRPALPRLRQGPPRRTGRHRLEQTLGSGAAVCPRPATRAPGHPQHLRPDAARTAAVGPRTLPSNQSCRPARTARTPRRVSASRRGRRMIHGPSRPAGDRPMDRIGPLAKHSGRSTDPCERQLMDALRRQPGRFSCVLNINGLCPTYPAGSWGTRCAFA